ncbi:TetR/AcrR family transcriptional regulator [Waterburya agarophytonicola K14]|uniref:TetR/AcrR family transcriptional regulator n=1 Tax=Waterburya agarophytonicola KI4 TaxID=2874699 RepID=A0A964FDB5_9CYAN|nr:TetR/AcrR family transcriptional regulator [Waterburya agarophytonicola]MCC0175375.1 TetR/AcrR family transcriptional regulator [Waterburya agarophytonicola KI4]
MNTKKKSLRRQPQQQRSQERVEKILDAAAIVFDEVGFEAATTHEIASRANTAIGSLYQFFPNKLAIFNALELRHVDRVYVIWERLLRPEIFSLPFADFIHTLIREFQKLFEQPTSKIVFSQFFTSPAIFKNIDTSFTQEAIQFIAKLFKTRNPKLSNKRSQLLGEICVHGINTLILLALRSDRSHSQEIFSEIEILLKKYLENDLGDDAIDRNIQPIDRLADLYQLTSRQSLILSYAANASEITIQNCEAMFDNVSRRTLQRDLKVLIQHQLLFPQGNTDRRCYCFNQKLTSDN